MDKTSFSAIKPENWPPNDLRLWTSAKQPVELFEDGGLAADWSEAYIENVELFYGQYLRFLEQTAGLDPAASPLDRVSTPIVRAFMDAFAPGRADGTLVAVLEGTAAVVRACHPPNGAPWLLQLAHRLEKRAKPLRPKHSRTASLDELIWLAERLMRHGQEMLRCRRRGGAPIFRDGLIIATWVVHPIRRSNMAALQMGRTLFVEGGRIRVHFLPKETKNGVELTREYPGWLVDHFLNYLENVRPILREAATGPDEGWVWIGRCGTRLCDQSLRVITTKRTRECLGRQVPPHNFRHSTVTDIARLEPNLVGITKDLLGHRSAATTEKFYILADSYRASRSIRSSSRRGGSGLRLPPDAATPPILLLMPKKQSLVSNSEVTERMAASAKAEGWVRFASTPFYASGCQGNLAVHTWRWITASHTP